MREPELLFDMTEERIYRRAARDVGAFFIVALLITAAIVPPDFWVWAAMKIGGLR